MMLEESLLWKYAVAKAFYTSIKRCVNLRQLGICLLSLLLERNTHSTKASESIDAESHLNRCSSCTLLFKSSFVACSE